MHDSVRQPPEPSSGREFELAHRTSELLPPCDFAALLVAGYASAQAYALLGASSWRLPAGLVWSAAAMAAFVLYDARFADRALRGERAVLWLGFMRRGSLYLAALLALAFGLRWLELAPWPWLAAWLALGLLLAGANRLLMARLLPRLAPVPGGAAQASRPDDTVLDSRLAALRVTVLAERPIRRWHAVTKAAMDYSLGALATLALLPALGTIALAIRLDDPGPVLFKQRRHGYNNREFEIYKFRTMRLGANPSGDVLQQTLRGDPRVTRVGRFLRKWSLDELPQLFNVLRGEMSLVGPRPHAVVMRTEERLGEEIVPSYPHRHRVKPGITGWAQVHGARGATDTAEQLSRRIELDLYYIEHCSPLLDLKVLLMTCREVLRATNAF